MFQGYFLTSEVDFDRYLWCSRAFGYFIVCLRCLILMLFVVAGHLLEAIACLQKSTLTAICRGRTWSVSLCFSSEVDFDRYLWCSRAIGYFIACLRCLILMLFVVAGHLLEVIACLQKSILNAICRGRTTLGSKYFC